MKNFLGSIIILSLIWQGCKVTQHSSESNLDQFAMRPAPVVIYKTKRDYREQVPIMISEDGKQVISYPHPNDLKFADGSYRYPLSLNKGYLLDRKGIGPRTVFLNLSYEEYVSNPPDPSALLTYISDEEPLEEIWHCYLKTNGETLTDSLNYLIEAQQLVKRCKKIK
jgi:hypothetical protein